MPVNGVLNRMGGKGWSRSDWTCRTFRWYWGMKGYQSGFLDSNQGDKVPRKMAIPGDP